MSQGKYHGKPLSATEVTRLYDAGERDFRGVILRGCDFFGVDLSGADFSRADIRSANFTLTVLKEANFTQVKCGVQKRWLLLKVILMTWFLTLFSAVSSAAKNSYLEHLIRPDYASQNNNIFNALNAITILFVFTAITTKVFSWRSAIFISMTGLILGISSISIVGANQSFGILAFLGIIFIFVTPLLSPYLVPNMSASLAVCTVPIIIIIVASALSIGIIQTFLLVRYTDGRYGLTDWSDEIGMASFVLTPLILFVVVCIWSEKSSFLWIVRLLKGFSVEFGTNFSGADLSYAKFSSASLKRSIFSRSGSIPVNLLHVRLRNANGLDYAWLGNTNLQDYRIRQLLTTLDGIDQDFSNYDLRGVNLAGARLHSANLRGANLNGALLEGAELYEANLTEANCIATDFTAAHLTGACLQSWNIDSATILEDIDCQYVFLREHPNDKGDRERRPHNPDKCFESGDFEKFFQEMPDTVQILIRNGIDPHTFRTAFENVMAEFPSITHNSIQSMERKGSDVLLTLHALESIDKGKLERLWDEGHQRGFKEGYTSGLLEGQKQRADDIKEVALGFSRFLSSFQINNMNNNNLINTGDGSFYAGGDVTLTGSTLNLGTISGQVSNQINQVPAPTVADQLSLKDILTQLQTAVETDRELSDEEKAEALQAVGRIATVGAEPNPDAKAKGIVKRATDTLKGLAESLTDASNLAEACKTLLPIILSLFALI